MVYKGPDKTKNKGGEKTMGLAKYFEKNMEINEERAMLRKQDNRPMPAYNLCTSVHIETVKINVVIKAKKDISKIIVCRDCGTSFNFTRAEQKFYEQRELSTPKRCHCCRNKRKASCMEITKQKEDGI